MSVPHAGTYRRELPVGLDRLYENALDWEHLPFLHRTTFAAIDCIDAGSWGWRANVELQPGGPDRAIVLELSLDRACRRWITRTAEGPGQGTEIWTHAFSEGDRRTDIVVDFFVPGVAPGDLPRIGEFYCQLYARLYDEDVWMMTERQVQLDRNSDPAGSGPETVVLGARAGLELPLVTDFAGRSYRVVEVDGELVAHAAVCPHLLGPLTAAAVCDGVVECPWHGYRYDVRTGAELGGRRTRLAPAPKVACDGGVVTLLPPAP